MANTSPVVTRVSLRDGQVTLLISLRTSRTNFAGSIATPLPPSDRMNRMRSKVLGLRLAGVEGLEPPASGFGDRRSSQLSYTPAGSPAADRSDRHRLRGGVKRPRTGLCQVQAGAKAVPGAAAAS